MSVVHVPDGDAFSPATEQDTLQPAPPGRAGTGRSRTRLLVAATAAWTVFVVLHILLTDRWWPWLVVEATPPLALVAVPLLLLVLVPLAAPVRRRLTAVLVLLLLTGVHLAGYGPGWTGDANRPRGTAVKVFAWNTNFWQMSDDKDAFYAFLRRQDADVYLLQEYLYWQGDQPIRIDDSARLRAEFPGYRLLVQGELITLSRLPVVATPDQQVPSTGTDWFWRGAKAQRTDIRVGGRTVSFYNVHLPVPFRFEGSPLRGRFYRLLREQDTWRLGELRKLRAELTADPYPAVVAGDFNSPWMELSPLGAGTQVHSPPVSVLPARSWPASAEFPLPRLWRLDWLYTTGDLAVASYRFGTAQAFSDHATQEIRVVVPDEAPSAHR
ncbi:MAG TPA: endonuclease/exonuclease/phosphatase family protein [Micromonosporaceae bacterium]